MSGIRMGEQSVDATRTIPAEKVIEAIGSTGMIQRRVRWRTLDIIVKPILSFEEYSTIVRYIVVQCESRGGVPLIELIDYAVRANVLFAYTNISRFENTSDLYRVLYCSDLYDSIIAVINQAQYKAIIYAISIYFGREVL